MVARAWIAATVSVLFLVADSVVVPDLESGSDAVAIGWAPCEEDATAECGTVSVPDVP